MALSSPLSRRHFIGRLTSVATVAATPTVGLPTEPAVLGGPAVPPATGRLDRLQRLLAEARRLAAEDFSDFDFRAFPLGEDEGRPDLFGFVAMLKPEPPEPPVIEYDGPGLYEIRLKQWSADFHQIHRVEMAPRRHRFAGQFRLRFPDAKPRARWWYVPRDDFAVIKRI
ncbi:exported hypothetical protein [uncultured Pleomorphomonas sp.]|uniref:Uncharacterized protein n=1 Tax=uncultured Pleomorphomonas sp. TaxID=442121 RepID=A0A212L3Z0_9HYPH|nr:hypothetical protein [uncultured Pleomorphomonas sp.]SCM72294.1 exported hypothetical protein [uncultured Pleomorphomonas sp.]